MDDVQSCLIRKVSPDGAGQGIIDIGGTHQTADRCNDPIPLQHHGHHGTRKGVGNQFFIKILTHMFPIVDFDQFLVQLHQFKSNYFKTLPFKTGKDLPNNTALQNAGL